MREADIAKNRLLSVPGDPLLHVEWHRVLFFNYVIAPEVVRPFIPSAFELDLHQGQACISLVSVTMRNYRRAPHAPIWGKLFETIREQRFLNFRIYVRHHGEPGAFFMWGWLSRPFGLPLPDEPLGLTCAFADFRDGCITGKNASLVYDVPLHDQLGERDRPGRSRRRPADGPLNDADTGTPKIFGGTPKTAGGTPALPRIPCASGSISEFALERYSGFFAHRGANYVFRAWHEPWLATPVSARVEDASLITSRFPWFAKATFVDAAYAPLANPVWLGRAHRLQPIPKRTRTFFEMPCL